MPRDYATLSSAIMHDPVGFPVPFTGIGVIGGSVVLI